MDGGYVANDNNNAYDVFVRDMTTDTTELISRANAGARLRRQCGARNRAAIIAGCVVVDTARYPRPIQSAATKSLRAFPIPAP